MTTMQNDEGGAWVVKMVFQNEELVYELLSICPYHVLQR